MVTISNHVQNRVCSRLQGLVTLAEIEQAIKTVPSSMNPMLVLVKDLGRRVKIVERDTVITGDIVWIVIRNQVVTTVMIRRRTQNVPQGEYDVYR